MIDGGLSESRYRVFEGSVLERGGGESLGMGREHFHIESHNQKNKR